LTIQMNGINKNSLVIQRDNLPDGVYHYLLIEQDKKISEGKIMIQ
jgi:hypothetical protein